MQKLDHGNYDKLLQLWDDGTAHRIDKLMASPPDWEAYQSASVVRYLADGNRKAFDVRTTWLDELRTQQIDLTEKGITYAQDESRSYTSAIRQLNDTRIFERLKFPPTP